MLYEMGGENGSHLCRSFERKEGMFERFNLKSKFAGV
jgi:hypothetical protein